MPQPRSTAQWPLSGERTSKATLQFATPVVDAMGGRGEPVWTNFGTWWCRISTLPDVNNETEAAILYQAEGPYRADLLTRFRAGTGIRIVVNGQTLKVFQVENPLLRNRTLVAHCGDALNTQ